MIYLDHLCQATNGVLHNAGKQSRFDAFSHDTRQLPRSSPVTSLRLKAGKTITTCWVYHSRLVGWKSGTNMLYWSWPAITQAKSERYARLLIHRLVCLPILARHSSSILVQLSNWPQNWALFLPLFQMKELPLLTLMMP